MWRMNDANAKPTAVQVLAAVPYFGELDPTTLEHIARMALRRVYDVGQMVFVEGSECEGLFVVEDGWFKATRISSEGREQVLRIVGPGEFFNEIGILSGARNQVNVTALENAVLWVVPRDAMLMLLDREPHVGRIVAQNLAVRVVHLLSLIQDLSLRSVEARLARWLLQQATDDLIVRQRWLTQAELAARLGTVPDVLQRALRDLVEANLIQLERRQIQILDRAGLEAIAQE